ncbi:LysR family transcriptional regulator [Nocardioides sp. GXQ0305]|uniref:LysR family transcriptional regulator n=1 Tax=Nocardioides sp. GXQ0305 TaxID=3423912 RepID=UPI003D7DFE63
MRLRDLEWLVAVADQQHVTEAAAGLGVPQPTLSRALARVEDELGARLLERVPTGVRVNPDGELVVEAARDLTARYRALLSELAGRHDPDGGLVRLAFLDSMATSVVPRLLRDFHREAPAVRLSLRQEPGHVILEDLEAGLSELAVTSARPSGPWGWLPLQEERIVLVVGPAHALRDRQRVTLAEVARQDLITTPVGFGYRAMVDDLFRSAGVTPRVAFESGDLATIAGLVSAGLGVALLPEQLAGQSGTTGIAVRARSARRVVGLMWRADRPLTPPAQRFRDFVAARVDTAVTG